jgi:S-adenosylmethionine-diacylglycerol 3-amino-3-carboxypropyl transferase
MAHLDDRPRAEGAAPFMANLLLERAAHTKPVTTGRGALERLFTLMFKGFVYNQIWEDPDVDLKALALESHHRLITIASGGCNVLNYLAANPAAIIAIDLNANHVALTRLKIMALRELPDHETFFQFFGQANDDNNCVAFDDVLRKRLDKDTRDYWEKSIPLHGRRINMFARNFYRYSLLGRFIGILHILARLQGKCLEDILKSRNPAEQRSAFNSIIAPLFDHKAIKLLSKSPVSLYALGIPPAQYDELMADCPDDPLRVLRQRVEKLACDFPMNDNYFAWQAFSRGYDTHNREAIPAYLRRETYDVIRARTDRVEVHHASLIDFLRKQPAQSLHRFVLLDAQD